MNQPLQANAALRLLAEIASDAHSRVQQNFTDLNPVIGVMQGMRKMGIPADVMSIDCLRSKKRILVILQDDMPDLVRYQFGFLDQDPADEYLQLPMSALSAGRLYEWMTTYFLAGADRD